MRAAPVLAALALRPGVRVLDVGAGRGEWALAIAPALGAGGVVLALDLWTEGLSWLAARRGRLPVLPLRADAARALPLADASVDGVLLALVLHHLAACGAAATALREIARVLRPGGHAAVVEFAPLPPPPGPPLELRLAPARVHTLLAAAGLDANDPLPVAANVLLYGARRPG